MRKPLFYAAKFSFFVAALFLLPSLLSAQCGVNSFPSGGTLNPTTTWQAAPSVGSGTYVDFNISNAQIYSFRYTNSPNIGGNIWDMTLSQTSTPLAYNNSLSPVKDPWTGGELCGPARPASADWFSSYNGTVRVNTNTWNGANCFGYVAGQTSAILEYKTCAPASDPGVGVNQWNVDAFVTTDVNIPNNNARYGYYSNTAVDFITATHWAVLSNPSTAPGWVGCTMPDDNFVLRARRTGFPCGVYQLRLNTVDDKFTFALNGTTLFTANAVTTNQNIGDPNGYVLGPNDNIEMRLAALCQPDQADIRFIPVTNIPAINPGSIGSLTNPNVCENSALGLVSSTGAASGGVSAYSNGGGIIYSWEFSTDGGATFNNVAGVNTPDFNTPYNVPPNAVYVLRRRASDKCGNTAVSNTITFTGRPAPNGSLNPTSQTVCPGSTATLTLNFNTGLSPFDIAYTDGISNFTATGVITSNTLTVTPPTNATTYSFTSITDSYGCVRTTGFTGGALVNVVPTININSVNAAPAGCFGASTGSITINATGGQSPLIYSIDNGATFQNPNVFTGLAAGPYNIVVQDNFGCSQPYGTTVNVGQPTAVSHTTTFTDASCAGVFDGTITVNATGGTPAYTYSLNGGPTQPGNVFNGVAAGTYSITTFDNQGCSFTSSVTVGSSYVVGVTVQAQSNVTCFGAANGTATVQVVGGIPPYDYSLNGVTYQSSGTFAGLAGGTYNIIGRDSKGCIDVAVVTITQPSQVVVTIDSVVNVQCFGGGSGGIYITASGGTPGYTFNWSNSVITEDNLNIPAGTYNVTATDANGCVASAGATVAQPLELFLNVAQFSNPLCFNDTTGTIDITANGGTPPYAYVWSNGPTTEDVVNLAGGVTYTATVTDASGCQKVISQALTQPTPITSSVTGTDVTCNGSSDGTADLTVSGGTAPYLFQWSTFDGTEDVTGLDGGLYFVYITDFNGCVHRDSVTINEPQPLVLTTQVTNISCFNSNDGAIDLTVTGGTGPYTYAWSSTDVTEDLSGLGGATYAVTVTDDNGCTAATSVLLVNPPLINTSFVVKNPLCFMDTNGLIDLIPSGGTPPYTYLWNPTSANTEDLTAVPAGTYTVSITDSKGCVKVDSATLTQPAPLVTSGFITNVTCNGYCDGVVDVTAYGGTLPYSFQWSNGSSTEDIIQVCGGNNFVTVTDVNGCTAATLYPVLEPAQLTSSITTTNVTCFGAKTGTITVTPAGGTTPYEYLWNNFNIDSSQSNVLAGTYVVLVTDSNGCHIYDSATITQPTQILVSGVVTDAACFGAPSGAIDVTATGGTGTLTYAWNPGGATTEDLTGIAAGTYTLTVTDANGCIVSETFTVVQSSGLASNVAYGSPTCFNGTNGFIDLDITGGTAPYNYTWNTTPVQTGHTAFNLAAGSYSVTVTDANNCSTVIAATLNNPTQLQVTANGAEATCYNSPTGSVVAVVTGGAAPYVYQLNGVIQASDTFFGLTPGQYVIAVRDANGCEATDVFTITSPSEVSVLLTAAQELILAGMETQLLATSTSTSDIVQHAWSWTSIDTVSRLDFRDCLDTTNCDRPYTKPQATTTYVVTVTNQDGCTASDTVTIVVEIDERAFWPSAFTPNGDGLNDRFVFDVLGVLDAKVEIYDRWGGLVYKNDAQQNGLLVADAWDGTNDGKALSSDTYVYLIKARYISGEEKDFTGTITLMK